MNKTCVSILVAVLLLAAPLMGCVSQQPIVVPQPTSGLALVGEQAEADSEPAPGLSDDGLTLITDDTPSPTDADAFQQAAASPTPKPTAAATATPKATHTPKPTHTPAPAIDENGTYTSRDDVALYLYTYGHLPKNFITKRQAQDLGWPGGGLDDYAYGKCIGGDRFGNYEGLLPERNGRKYTECDIDTLHKRSRGSKRIIFSNDGLIYYTSDHYESFTLLYGEE